MGRSVSKILFLLVTFLCFFSACETKKVDSKIFATELFYSLYPEKKIDHGFHQKIKTLLDQGATYEGIYFGEISGAAYRNLEREKMKLHQDSYGVLIRFQKSLQSVGIEKEFLLQDFIPFEVLWPPSSASKVIPPGNWQDMNPYLFKKVLTEEVWKIKNVKLLQKLQKQFLSNYHSELQNPYWGMVFRIHQEVNQAQFYNHEK